MNELRNRGTEDILLAVVDGLKGFPEAITAVFPETVVHTLKRDYVRVSPLPNALNALPSLARWIEDYNDNHPHSGLKMRSPREHRALVSATA